MHGGYGYTREYPVERFYRDNRLNPIHEGTHGIQALDLLGRKVQMQDVAAFSALLAEIRLTSDACRAQPRLRAHAGALDAAVALVDETTQMLRDVLGADARLALANASTYLEMFGHIVVAWIWLGQARAALAGVAGAGSDLREGKLLACDWFFRWELPKVALQAKLLQSLDRTLLDLRVERL